MVKAERQGEDWDAVVIGAGPAGLMATEVLGRAGLRVLVADAKPSFARKFLMAGKSGLNITKDEPFDELLPNYGHAQSWLAPMLRAFDAQAVQGWASGLDVTLFTGSTGRVFPVEMKASPLLRAWLARLDGLGIARRTRWRWIGWDRGATLFETPEGLVRVTARATVLALGGASWARLGSDGEWSTLLADQGVALKPFAASNSAISVDWSPHMVPYFGTPLKSVSWRADTLRSRGEAILSARGLEGGGVYSLSPAIRHGHGLFLDLVPDLDEDTLRKRLPKKLKKARLSHWLKNTLRLPPVKTALFFESAKGAALPQAEWISLLKNLPVPINGLCAMDEAISTVGGVAFEAVDEQLMLHEIPGTFCAGEMLDWDAPTGGYLLTACLATGSWVGHAAVRYLAAAAR